MTFRDYAAVLWRRKFVIIVPLIIAIVAVLGLTLLAPTTYTASTTVRVPTASAGSPNNPNPNLNLSDRLINTYAVIATSEPQRRDLAEGLGISVDDLPEISVEPIFDTELIVISVTAEDPELAAEAANILSGLFINAIENPTSQSAADILLEEIGEREVELNEARENYRDLVERFGTQDDRVITAGNSLRVLEQSYTDLLQQYEQTRVNQQLNITTAVVVEPASVPTEPNTSNLILNLGVAIILALGLGVTLAFLLDNLDNRLYTTRAIRRAAHLPIIDEIPSGRRGAVVSDIRSERLTQFRDLRTSIYMMAQDGPVKSLLVTGSETGALTTEMVANLGVATARGGRKALVIDGNLRTPRLHKLFSLSNERGLTELCADGSTLTLEDVIQPSAIDGLHVLAAGSMPEDPPELLASDCVRDLLASVTETYDMILIDAPPVTAATDAQVLAIRAQATVLVVRHGQTRGEDIEAAREQLEMVSGNLLGLIVNT